MGSQPRGKRSQEPFWGLPRQEYKAPDPFSPADRRRPTSRYGNVPTHGSALSLPPPQSGTILAYTSESRSLVRAPIPTQDALGVPLTSYSSHFLPDFGLNSRLIEAGACLPVVLTANRTPATPRLLCHDGVHNCTGRRTKLNRRRAENAQELYVEAEKGPPTEGLQ